MFTEQGLGSVRQAIFSLQIFSTIFSAHGVVQWAGCSICVNILYDIYDIMMTIYYIYDCIRHHRQRLSILLLVHINVFLLLNF